MNSLITQSKQIPAIGLAVALLVLGLLAACKPKVEPMACTPLPIVDGFETAMTEGGKMRLRVPARASRLSDDCKQIKSTALAYFWHKGKLVLRDKDNHFDAELNGADGKNRVIEVYLESFVAISDITPTQAEPWRYEKAIKHDKYPLELYPQFFWSGPHENPLKPSSDVKWGVVGTNNPVTKQPFTTYCAIEPGPGGTQADVVHGDFTNDIGYANCRGGVIALRGNKAIGATVDVWLNNAHDIDKIYNAVIEKIQTYIEE